MTWLDRLRKLTQWYRAHWQDVDAFTDAIIDLLDILRGQQDAPIGVLPLSAPSPELLAKIDAAEAQAKAAGYTC